MRVAIASKGRAGEIKNFKWLTIKPEIFVEPQEYENYLKEYGYRANIVNIGKNDQGLTFVRNYILDYYQEPFLMLDDDVDDICERVNGKLVKANIDHFFKYLEETMVKKDLTQLGVSFRPSNRFNSGELKYFDRAWAIKYINPLKLKNIRILDFGMGSFEDYVLCLQMYVGGRVFATTYKYAFGCSAKMGTNKGGCQTFRNAERSKIAAYEIQRRFGPRLVEVKYSDLHNQYEVQIKWSNMRKGL